MAVLLDIKNACKRYGDQVLLDQASATITDDGRSATSASTIRFSPVSRRSTS
jgi:hypothetical protein